MSFITVEDEATGRPVVPLAVDGAIKVVATIDGGIIGGATEAKQDAGNASLAAIDASTNGLEAGLATLETGKATAALQTSANTKLDTIATNQAGQATAAAQATGNASLATTATNTGTTASKAAEIDDNTDQLETLLTSIDGKTPALVGGRVPVKDSGTPSRSALVATITLNGTAQQLSTATGGSAVSQAGWRLKAPAGGANILWGPSGSEVSQIDAGTHDDIPSSTLATWYAKSDGADINAVLIGGADV